MCALYQQAPFENMKFVLCIQFTQIDDDLRKNEGRLFFGGEHTMSPHGWIDTAMKSGVRVALQATNAKF